jgi:hypothetical protein
LETRNNPDIERVSQRLRDMAQAVLNDDDDYYDGDDTGRISPRRLSPLRVGDRFDSPDRNLSRYVSFLFKICFFKMSLGRKHNFFYSSLLVRTFIFLVINKKIDFQNEMSGLFE